MKRRFSSARRAAERRRRARQPAKASTFICHLDAVAKPGDAVDLYLRVSSWEQHDDSNLDAQEAFMRRACEKRGLRVLEVFREVGSGWSDDLVRRLAAAEHARLNNAILVAESADRLLRSELYSNIRQDELPSKEEWENFAIVNQRITVATLHHPDMPWRKVRSKQIKRGIRHKAATSKRPKKKRRCHRTKARYGDVSARVFAMHDKRHSLRAIERKLGVPKNTVARWINAQKQGVPLFPGHHRTKRHVHLGKPYFTRADYYSP